MKTSILLAGACATSLLFAQYAPAQTVATDPVGFITLDVKGTGGASANVLSYIGLGMTQVVSYQGNLESVSGATVVDNDATWTDNQYNGAGNANYLEIISGPGAGLFSSITATNAAAKSITLAQDLSAVITPGTNFRIRKNWTIGTLFGATNSAGLQGGTSTSADEILIYNPANGLYTTYYYKTTGLGGTGWRTTNSTSIDASGDPLSPTAGVLIRRKQSADVSFSLVGAVKLGQTAIPVQTGLNFVSNVYPSGSLTLGSSNLRTGNDATGVAGGTSSTADQVLIYQPNAVPPVYKTYYYKTSGLGGTGWRSTESTSIDESTAVIPVGQSIIIQRTQGRAAFNWVVPQPF